MAESYQENNRSEADSAKAPKQPEQKMPFLYKCLFCAMIVLSLTFFLTYLMRTNQLLQEANRLNEEIEKKEEEVEELRYLIDSPVDDAYIIRVAREKLGMCFPDEIIYHTEYN